MSAQYKHFAQIKTVLNVDQWAWPSAAVMVGVAAPVGVAMCIARIGKGSVDAFP